MTKPIQAEKDGKPRSRRRRRGCCLGSLIGFVGIPAAAVLAGFLWGDSVFSIRSNLLYLAFRQSQAPVQVRPAGESWSPLKELTAETFDQALRERFHGPGFRWRTLEIRREPAGRRQHLARFLGSGDVHIVELSPEKFSFETAFNRGASGDFDNLTASAILDDAGGDGVFAINANYYDPEGQPLGLIVHRETTVNREIKPWSGFFFVKDDVPRFGPRSLFEETPGTLTEAAQGYPSVMKNGAVFHYLETAPNRFFNGRERTFRSLGGVKADGTVVFVLSGSGGILDMGEVSQIARLGGVRHATLLDGGRSLQYRFSHEGRRFAFHAFNNRIEMNGFLDNRLVPERPPVYLLVRKKPE